MTLHRTIDRFTGNQHCIHFNQHTALTANGMSEKRYMNYRHGWFGLSLWHCKLQNTCICHKVIYKHFLANHIPSGNYPYLPRIQSCSLEIVCFIVILHGQANSIGILNKICHTKHIFILATSCFDSVWWQRSFADVKAVTNNPLYAGIGGISLVTFVYIIHSIVYLIIPI